MILQVDDSLGWGVEAIGHSSLDFCVGAGNGGTAGTSCIWRSGWEGPRYCQWQDLRSVFGLD